MAGSVSKPLGIRTILGLLTLLAVSCAILLVYPLWKGQLAQADRDAAAAGRLVEHLMGITSNLQVLATGVLGLLGFLFSDKVSHYWKVSTRQERNVLLVGATSLIASIITGLLTHWAMASALVDGTVISSAERVVLLQVVQLLELGAGVVLVFGVAVFGAIGRSQ